MTRPQDIREFWEQRAKKFAKRAPTRIDRGRVYNFLMTRTHRRQLKKVLEICRPKITLEVGVGQGRLFSKLVHSTRVGIDVSINMLRKCRIIDSSANTIQAEATHLPFKDGCFDLVYTCAVLLHIPDKFVEMAISEMKRVSAEYILIIEPPPDFQHPDEPYLKSGYCFPHKYEELFQLPIKYKKKLNMFNHEVILFTKFTTELH
jgi:ubiquinone/menaquinone biosynthesis C-methylase UbiE